MNKFTTRAQREHRQINNGLWALALAGISARNQKGKIPNDIRVALIDNVITVVPMLLSKEVLRVRRGKGYDVAQITGFLVKPEPITYYIAMRGKNYSVKVAPKLESLSFREWDAMMKKGTRAYYEPTCQYFELPREI